MNERLWMERFKVGNLKDAKQRLAYFHGEPDMLFLLLTCFYFLCTLICFHQFGIFCRWMFCPVVNLTQKSGAS